MPAPTVHVLGLPHTETVADGYSWCAYTQKVRRFCDMLTSVGRRVVLYAGTHNEAAVDEHVVVVNDYEQRAWFKDWDPELSAWDGFDLNAVWWRTMNARAIDAVRARAEPGDFLGVIAGHCQSPVVAALPELLPVEWGVGYPGVLEGPRAFESLAWMHHVYGTLGIDGRAYDTVIPNAYDPAEFTFAEAPTDEYLLFLGRHVPRKGTEIVMELARHFPVVTAGQGGPLPGCDYRGVVGPAERASLLAGARALLAPTQYVEPFGGVVVEAAFAGTPAITSTWGAFTETVAHGQTGFRCALLRDYIAAAKDVDRLSRLDVRLAAMRYSVAGVAVEYDNWLDRVSTLSGAGWYAP